ncbi:MAG: acetolactate synthase small subunit [Candidatus Omnitrophota bacterium]
MKHTLSVLVENKFGVLARVAGLFSARGFNISSLAVGETHDPSVSRMTVVVDTPEVRILEQIIKQLRKLIDTISVVDLTKKDFIERELALVKVKYNKEVTGKVNALLIKHKRITRMLRHKNNEAIIEVCATSEQVEEFIDNLKPCGVQELMRTGRVAVS